MFANCILSAAIRAPLEASRVPIAETIFVTDCTGSTRAVDPRDVLYTRKRGMNSEKFHSVVRTLNSCYQAFNLQE